ncbi:leucine Rich repeat-containing domain protein, partial [Teladorsagia circumcincta]
RGMLDGMRNLQQLNLCNNSLTAIDEYTFASLRFLTTLDLAHNSLSKIAKFLPPLEKLPTDLIASVIQGENLPGLNEEQTKVIKDYYTARLPPPPPNGREKIPA